MVWDFKCLEDLEEKDESVSQLVNHLIRNKAVCRTSPATLGLLNIIVTNCSMDKYKRVKGLGCMKIRVVW